MNKADCDDQRYCSLLRQDWHLLKSAITERNERQWKRSVRSLFSHLRGSDGLQALSVALASGAAQASQQVPRLCWLKDLALAIPAMRIGSIEAGLRSLAGEQEHYYQAITGVIVAFRDALEAARVLHQGGDPTGLLTGAATVLIDSLSEMAWSFRHPEEYALWWANAVWMHWGDGPAPPTLLPENRTKEDPSAVVIPVLESLAEWVQQRASLET